MSFVALTNGSTPISSITFSITYSANYLVSFTLSHRLLSNGYINYLVSDFTKPSG